LNTRDKRSLSPSLPASLPAFPFRINQCRMTRLRRTATVGAESPRAREAACFYASETQRRLDRFLGIATRVERRDLPRLSGRSFVIDVLVAVSSTSGMRYPAIMVAHSRDLEFNLSIRTARERGTRLHRLPRNEIRPLSGSFPETSANRSPRDERRASLLRSGMLSFRLVGATPPDRAKEP